MNVASLELCRELYELSGWAEERQHWWYWINPEDHQDYSANEGRDSQLKNIPAYDAGFLLRNLPLDVEVSKYSGRKSTQKYHATYFESLGTSKSVVIRTEAHTAEDALCKLCVELFKEGVLTK